MPSDEYEDSTEQFANTWIKDHPKDLAFVVYQGDNALARKDYANAEAAYRQVVELQPNHVTSLNNIAWLMVKANKPGALPFAVKANELQPNQPALMDTLAVALAADKRVDQAIELQKKALALAPESNTLRLTLASRKEQISVAGREPTVSTDAEFEPALRAALAAEGPTVIQLALDRSWVSVDRPAG